mmetsp:Transcript_91736/g.218568  ORF Transcript_91736/g.218568 Transcript_91736/m.218568 type:complete len:140 (-) Transcript_91736:1981-2400(-)
MSMVTTKGNYRNCLWNQEMGSAILCRTKLGVESLWLPSSSSLQVLLQLRGRAAVVPLRCLWVFQQATGDGCYPAMPRVYKCIALGAMNIHLTLCHMHNGSSAHAQFRPRACYGSRIEFLAHLAENEEIRGVASHFRKLG